MNLGIIKCQGSFLSFDIKECTSSEKSKLYPPYRIYQTKNGFQIIGQDNKSVSLNSGAYEVDGLGELELSEIVSQIDNGSICPTSTASNSVDHEILSCIGLDSAALASASFGGVVGYDSANDPLTIPNTISGNTIRLTLAPAFGFPSAEIELLNDFTGAGQVSIFMTGEVIGSSPFIGAPTFELRDFATSALVATFTVPMNYNFATTTQSIQFDFDNTITNFSKLKIVLPGQFEGRDFEFAGVSISGVLGSAQATLIRKIEKYQDGDIVSTEYFDMDGNIVTLNGSFIKDSNYQIVVELASLPASIAKAIYNCDKTNKIGVMQNFNGNGLNTLPVAAGTMGRITHISDTGAGLLRASLLTDPNSNNFPEFNARHSIDLGIIDLSTIQFRATSNGSDYTIIYQVWQ
jgi:hypothetical protein